MTWRERLQTAAYTSPSGLRLPFRFRRVSKTTPLRTKLFEFSGVDDGYWQQHGKGPRSFPLQLHFSGPDHDLQSATFEAACEEIGIGRLEHPMYGTVPVVPVGDVVRRDDLVDEANKSVIEVTFSRSLASVYPTISVAPKEAVAVSIAAFNTSAASQYKASLNVSTALARAEVAGDTKDILGSYASTLGEVSTAVGEVEGEADRRRSAIISGIDTLVGTPLNLAAQILDLTQLPARSLDSIASRLDSYGLFAADLFGLSTDGDDGATLPDIRTKTFNRFASTDLAATGAVAGAALACVETDYRSRNEALGAADGLLEQFEGVIGWRERRLKSLGHTEQGDAHQTILAVVSKAVGYLVDSSATLRPERTLVVTRPRNFVELCFELYGNVLDETLDTFIDHNRLTGTEILEIPRGRTISYYA